MERKCKYTDFLYINKIILALDKAKKDVCPTVCRDRHPKMFFFLRQKSQQISFKIDTKREHQRPATVLDIGINQVIIGNAVAIVRIIVLEYG